MINDWQPALWMTCDPQILNDVKRGLSAVGCCPRNAGVAESPGNCLARNYF